MNIREKVRGAMRRAGEVSLRDWLATNLSAGRDGRRTAGAGSQPGPIFPLARASRELASLAAEREAARPRTTTWCRSRPLQICGASRRLRRAACGQRH